LGTEHLVEDLQELGRADPNLAVERAGLTIKLLALTLGILLALFAAWLFHFSLRVQRAGRFPPPGARLIRESRILTGVEAETRARRGFIMAAIIAAAAVALPAYLWHITDILTLP
jgi:hypothetical protein